MSMFVWPDGTVTGSVNVEELEAIQKGLKGVGKRNLADLAWPVESAEHLADLLAGTDDSEPDKKSAKASDKSKADTTAEAEKATAMSQVDLPAALAKSTKKEKS